MLEDLILSDAFEDAIEKYAEGKKLEWQEIAKDPTKYAEWQAKNVLKLPSSKSDGKHKITRVNLL